MRCFFHISYGDMTWDSEGTELPNLDEARNAAIRLSGALLSDLETDRLWHGVPWHLWVTDGPNGTGNSLFALSFSAKNAQ